MYSTDTNLYYMYGKVCTKREILDTIGDLIRHYGILWNPKISYPPVYSFSVADTSMPGGYLMTKYSNTPSKVYPSVLVIPEVYKVTKSGKDEYYGYKMSLRDLYLMYTKFNTYTYTYHKYVYHRNHTTHKAYNYHGKLGRLVRFYSRANSEDIKIRHNNRFKSYKSRYSRVLDWDNTSSSSSGWKSQKKRHQWD